MLEPGWGQADTVPLVTIDASQMRKARYRARMEVDRIDRGFWLAMLTIVVTFAVTFVIGRVTHTSTPAGGTEDPQTVSVLADGGGVPASLSTVPPIALIAEPKKSSHPSSYGFTPAVQQATVQPVTPASSPTPTVKAVAPPVVPTVVTISPAPTANHSSGGGQASKPSGSSSPGGGGSSGAGGHGSFDSSG